MSVTAADIINIVRDLIPDPVYNSSGTALPGTDGSLYRSQTILRFINDGAKALAGQMGFIVEDWTTFAVTAGQPWYAVDSKWIGFDEAFQNGFRLSLMPEGLGIWPRALPSGQSFQYSLHKLTNHIEVGLFPVPSGGDPTTTLSPGITPTSTTIGLVTSLSFLPFGYISINSEVIAYQSLTPSTGTATMSILSRAQSGTTAATHTSGETVSHLSAWFKGMRTPNDITATTDVIELPDQFIYALQEYVIAKLLFAQNDDQGGKLHMEEFRREAKRIQGDPGWRTDSQGCQAMAYGMPLGGRYIWGGTVILP